MLFGQSRRKNCHVLMTVLRPLQILNRRYWHASTAFTALPLLSKRLAPTSVALASSPTDTAPASDAADEDRTMTTETSVDCYRAWRLLSALTALSFVLGACSTYTSTETVTASIPNDYRL